jgi:pimeloyl-ACP methyl ester carboxylesterase
VNARLLAVVGSLVLAGWLVADGPGDNLPDKVRPIPPKGIEVPEDEQRELTHRLDELGKEIEALPAALKGKPGLQELLPDVEVLHKAIRYALKYGEVYGKAELKQARTLLAQGRARAKQLREGKPGWTTETGLVVRGYRSKIDGSVQPYGLVVPASYRLDAARPYRLDVWLHGRGEKLTELNFITERLRSPGLFTPPGAFVLHPYGRYCNAFKLAGEVDVLEALAHARQHYRIDEDRVVMRGFSMGGAGCWQFAVHYPDRWVAAAPGAGFSETRRFLETFQKETLNPTWYEKKLWQMYDCPGWARNLFNLPTVAYSGELDRQKQAADMMVDAVRAEGMVLTHLIGPKTYHDYHPQLKEEINRRIDRIVAAGRHRVPARVHLATFTLRYNRSYWVRVDGLAEHWKKATLDAEMDQGGRELRVKTENVSAFTLSFGPGDCPLTLLPRPVVVANGQRLDGGPAQSDRCWSASFRKGEKGWEVVRADEPGLHKRHGLQGPIDDAFLDRFLMVRPTGKPLHARTAGWVKTEMQHAVEQWRQQFRGDAPVKDDSAVTDDDIARGNLVLWGDPSSNRVLAKIVEKLPIRWDAKQVSAGKESWPADSHVPLLIYPNPLNPKRYVVLNSGFTYREYAYLNNARQVPKLPDWAVLDVRQPATTQWPGKVVGAGFFDERWRLKDREQAHD